MALCKRSMTPLYNNTQQNLFDQYMEDYFIPICEQFVNSASTKAAKITALFMLRASVNENKITLDSLLHEFYPTPKFKIVHDVLTAINLFSNQEAKTDPFITTIADLRLYTIPSEMTVDIYQNKLNEKFSQNLRHDIETWVCSEENKYDLSEAVQKLQSEKTTNFRIKYQCH